VIRLLGLPTPGRAPHVRIEGTPDDVVLWFLGDERQDVPAVRRIAVPRYTLGDGDPETIELEVLARLQDLGYDARRIAPRAEP